MTESTWRIAVTDKYRDGRRRLCLQNTLRPSFYDANFSMLALAVISSCDAPCFGPEYAGIGQELRQFDAPGPFFSVFGIAFIFFLGRTGGRLGNPPPAPSPLQFTVKRNL